MTFERRGLHFNLKPASDKLSCVGAVELRLSGDFHVDPGVNGCLIGGQEEDVSIDYETVT